jgi:hypothetical protein
MIAIWSALWTKSALVIIAQWICVQIVLLLVLFVVKAIVYIALTITTIGMKDL